MRYLVTVAIEQEAVSVPQAQLEFAHWLQSIPLQDLADSVVVQPWPFQDKKESPL